MLWKPNYFWITTGASEGLTPLNAFDNALLKAGIAHLNLLKVSSIVPKGACMSECPPNLAAGTLTPAVLAKITSESPGDIISSCVGVGLSRNDHGVIMEHTCHTTAAEAEDMVRQMVEQAFDVRSLILDRLILLSKQHQVLNVGSTVAVVILW